MNTFQSIKSVFFHRKMEGCRFFVSNYFLLDVQEVLYESEDSDLIRNLNMYVVNQFYRKPYDGNRDFYEQFYERLAAGKELLSLGM